MENITLNDIKKNNYYLIYHLIYQSGKISKQDIAAQLHLSLPTVTQNLNQLEEKGLIQKNGQFESLVGRKATAYTLCEKARIGIGAEILKDKIELTAIDLYGQILEESKVLLSYENNEAYFASACESILQFIMGLKLPDTAILGVGLAMQALVSFDGTSITYGKILDCTGLTIDHFQQHLPYPCLFIHDAQCAATQELWIRKDLTDALYLSVGYHLGGALLINGQIHSGMHGQSGTIEHMTLIPNGQDCYCGRKGCMEAYCSIHALLKPAETLDAFFESLRKNTPDSLRRWDNYLNNMAYAINNLHLLLDGTCILGGHLAPYLIEEDIKLLQDKVWERSTFPCETPFIEISAAPKKAVAAGAALPFIQTHLNSMAN